jgi:A nuclease family of the HNH/ENDO VII superfamily with conserved AHH
MTEVHPDSAPRLEVEDPQHDPATCCFCQKGLPIYRTNVFDCRIDEDDAEHLDPHAWVTFTNAVQTLGSNLGREQLPVEGYWLVEAADKEFLPVNASVRGAHAVGVVAHHLIPGSGALLRSRLFLHGYLGGPGTSATHVGYDINRAENGLWVPGNYAIRPWDEQDAAFQEAYAEAAIVTVQAQFHEAHPLYAERVLGALDAIADKVDHQRRICPFAGDQDPATRVLITLVARLDQLSQRCRRLLTFPVSGWKRNFFISRHARHFMNRHHLGGR